MEQKLELIGDIREMVYGEHANSVSGMANNVLAHGRYEDREFYILNIRGSHPCAYVNALPEDLTNMGISEWGSYDDVDPFVDAHGGVTYCSSNLHAGKDEVPGNWFGWDYAHCGDYLWGSVDIFFGNSHYDDHRWTVTEILRDVMSVIEDLKRIKET